MKIFLVGFMGSGKTTLGKRLAAKLDWNFIDLDISIEAHTGQTIPDYFKTHGETLFREMERVVLQTGHYPDNTIIATGGGAPCYFDNMDWMKTQGIVVYISLSPADLAARLDRSEEDRPVLQGYKGDALIGFIAGKLSEREPHYLQANIILSGRALSATKLWKAIDQHK
ncbi:Shikimate kinase I AroE I [Arcticibacter svalbardensis MN12-7]|uniref:Shikimate kinase n=1 Tax=Arcticibacter svalbardensis MN12-7 TaxID=1150600 RepID=R9GUP8_9SPHI|nr:shikimate kinase [Arcticibacter svalbardensis]EOR95456.1 Shikimate kinase I AroE I [Arcticibacter svalbardensis MN12-7]